MKRTISALVVLLAAGVMLAACTKKAASSAEAIRATESMQTVGQKTDYLVKQADAFLNSDEFDEAIRVAKHVLAKLDADSAQAKSLIERAKEEMQKKAQTAVDDMRKGLKTSVNKGSAKTIVFQQARGACV